MERFAYPEDLPLSLAVRTSGPLLFICGHVGDTPGMPEGSGIEEQTRACLESIERSLNSLGLDRTAIVRSLCFLSDLSLKPGFNAVYTEFFRGQYPTRTTVGAVLEPGTLIEIECVAEVPEGNHRETT